jgi:hypothetical protein
MSQLREELLISRVIDGDATTAEWDELHELARSRPAVWHELAETLRDHKAFARGMEAAVGIADAIDMPPVKAATIVEPSPLARIGRSSFLWTGWAIAAAVALTWILGLYQPIPRTSTPLQPSVQQAGLQMTAAEALQNYLDLGREEGHVVGMPERVLVDQRPAPDGEGVELLYMQPILIREHVPEAYRVGPRDELGRPSLIKYERPLDDQSPM